MPEPIPVVVVGPGYAIGYFLGDVFFALIRLTFYLIKKTFEFIFDLVRYTYLGVRWVYRYQKQKSSNRRANAET